MMDVVYMDSEAFGVSVSNAGSCFAFWGGFVHMKKRVFFSEAAYLAGLAVLAIGTALMEAADFGLSMVVAPAYLMHLRVSQFFPAFSFGMAEYVLQGILLVLLVILMRRVKLSYLFSFVTAVLYGLMLDTAMALMPAVGADAMILRAACYAAGLVVCSIGVALLFHTYIAPEAYELVVKEISGKRNLPIAKVKTVYDCISCAAAVAMSFAFFSLWHFEGVKLGTVLCALVNGTMIGAISKWLDMHFEFSDALKLRGLFER